MTQPLIRLVMSACFTLLGIIPSLPVTANDDIGSATKEDALKKAATLGCVGAYEWEGVWMPCEEDNEGPDGDHSGHDHSHDHDH